MEHSTQIAGLMGPAILLAAVPMILSPKRILTMAHEILAQSALIYVAGLIVFVTGLAIIRVHNVWMWNWQGLMTFFAWAMMLGGAARVLLPVETLNKLAQGILLGEVPIRISGVVWAAIGVILTLNAY